MGSSGDLLRGIWRLFCPLRGQEAIGCAINIAACAAVTPTKKAPAGAFRIRIVCWRSA